MTRWPATVNAALSIVWFIMTLLLVVELLRPGTGLVVSSPALAAYVVLGAAVVLSSLSSSS